MLCMTSFLRKSKEQAITRSGYNLFTPQLKWSDKATSISQNFTENTTAFSILHSQERWGMGWLVVVNLTVGRWGPVWNKQMGMDCNLNLIITMYHFKDKYMMSQTPHLFLPQAPQLGRTHPESEQRINVTDTFTYWNRQTCEDNMLQVWRTLYIFFFY